MQDFERIYLEHAQPLLRFLTYRTGDRSLAEDLVADTFERVLKSRSRFDRRKSSERTWIYSIALNLVRDHHRRTSVAARTAELSRGGETRTAAGDPFQQIEDLDLIQRALAQLSPEEREAISLRYGADLTIPEIAKVTKERLSTIEGRIYRSLRKLHQALA